MTHSKRYVPHVVLLSTVCVICLLAFGGENAFAAHAANPLNTNCTLMVPANPLSATGLSTPYQLTATDPAVGPCNEANTAQSAFVQASIIDPNGVVSVYSPLVIDAGTVPAVTPMQPTVPTGSVVGIWFGFNGNVLTLSDKVDCVNGLNTSNFGQFAYCNAPAFFAAAQKAIIVGSLVVPPLGLASDGMACPTVRDFSIVDQDQSDNVQSQYLIINGLMAQKTVATLAANPTATTVSNPSDNALLSRFVDPALGCKSWLAPDLANAGIPAPSLALDELQAWQEQQFPQALVPLNDPMTLVADRDNDEFNASARKTNLYRNGVGQHAVTDAETPKLYCQNIVATGIPRIKLDMPTTILAASPVPTVGNTLFTFLASRLQFTLSSNGLNCVKLLHMKNPVTLTLDGNGVAIAAAIK